MTPATAIQTLLASGWTEAKIATEVGATQPTINRIKRGAKPSYDVGVAIVALAEASPAAQEAA